MQQRMILFDKLKNPEYVHELQAAGKVRASMNVVDGPHEAIAMRTLAMSEADPCPPGSACYWLWQFLMGQISNAEPMTFVTFALLTVESGSRQSWAETVRQVEIKAAEAHGSDAFFLAAAHAFGPVYNGVVEVMANDIDVFHELLLGVTDVSGVQAADLNRVLPGDTRGFGTPG